MFAARAIYGPLGVTEAVEAVGIRQPAVTRIHTSLQKLRLTCTAPVKGDNRQKQIRLTPKGEALIEDMKHMIWPPARRAAQALCEIRHTDFIDQIDRLEEGLQSRPIHLRIQDEIAAGNGLPALRLVEYDDRLAADFAPIKREWVTDMFTLEANDIKIIENPQSIILDRGGELFLLTNTRCAVAVHLYAKTGFADDADIMERYGKSCARCNIAMSYDLRTPLRP